MMSSSYMFEKLTEQRMQEDRQRADAYRQLRHKNKNEDHQPAVTQQFRAVKVINLILTSIR